MPGQALAILGFFPKNQPNQIFPEKSGSVTFDPLWSLNLIKKKSEKTNEPILRKTLDGRTDVRTEKQTLIHRTLSNFVRGSNNKQTVNGPPFENMKNKNSKVKTTNNKLFKNCLNCLNLFKLLSVLKCQIPSLSSSYGCLTPCTNQKSKISYKS